MKKIVSVFLFILPTFIFGQKHFVSLKSGVNWANFNSKNFSFNNESQGQFGYSGGIGYELKLGQFLYTGIDLLYSQVGDHEREKGLIIPMNGPIRKGTSIVKFQLDYLSFPIKLGVIGGKKFIYNFGIGLQPSFLANAKAISISEFPGEPDEKSSANLTNKVTKFDLAAMAETGIGYQLKDQYLMFCSFSYFHGFYTITTKNYFEESKIYNKVLSIRLGLKYTLK